MTSSATMPSIYDFQVQTSSGEFKSLAEYRGQSLIKAMEMFPLPA